MVFRLSVPFNEITIAKPDGSIKLTNSVYSDEKPNPFLIPNVSGVPQLIPSYPPKSLIPFTPFSFWDIAMELDKFIAEVYPTLSAIAKAPIFTSDLQKQFYEFLNTKAIEFIQTSPYPGFSRIMTVMRTDGIVVVDKTVSYPNAVMIGGFSAGNTLSNVSITRQNTGDPRTYPSEISNVKEYLTLKVYQEGDGLIDYYDLFEPFSGRTEFVQANTCTYGWTTRPGIYVPGQLYAVAKAVGFYGAETITFFFRACYNKTG